MGVLFGYNQSGVGEAPSPDLVTTSSAGVIVSPVLSHETLRRNQFGGSIGGAIIKDRWFFFGDYRGTRDASGATALLSVPTQFVHDNCDTAGSSTCNLQEYFQGASTPAVPTQSSAFLMSLLPEPNLRGVSGPLLTNNYQVRGSEPLNSDNSDVRLDYASPQRLKFFARYSYDDFRQDGAPAFPNAGGPGTNPDEFAGRSRTYNQNGSAGFSYSLSSSLLTDFRFGYLRYHLDLNAPDFGSYPIPQSLTGLAGLNDSLYSSDLPDIELDNFFMPSMAGVLSPAAPPTTGYQTNGNSYFLRYGYSSQVNNCNCPLREREQQFQWVNNWTKMAGHHALRWGGDFRYIRNFRLDSANSRSGNLEFGLANAGDLPTQSTLYNL